MHAPATPGDSVPGDAAGDDSEQGSGSNEPEETPVARRIDSVEFGTPGDLRTLEVTDYCYATHLTPNEKFVVILNGAGLDDIPYIHLDYLKNGQMSEITIFRSDESTSNRAVFESSGGDTPEQAFVKYIEYNKEYFFNMRNSYNRIKIDLSVNDESMGTTTGGGIAYYDFDNEISAVANDGYHFVQWSDGDTRRERNIKLTGDIELTAIFAPDEAEEQPQQVTLTLNCDNDVVPAPSGAGTYDKGSTVTIEAVLLTPSENERGGITIYNFVQWSDGDYNRIREVVLENDLTLTALYVAQDQ